MLDTEEITKLAQRVTRIRSLINSKESVIFNFKDILSSSSQYIPTVEEVSELKDMLRKRIIEYENEIRRLSCLND